MRIGIAAMALAMVAQAQVTIEMAPKGGVQAINMDGLPVLGPVVLYVPKPGWQGSLFDLDELQAGQDGNTRTLQGVAGPADQPLADVVLRVTGTDVLEFLYEFTPRQEMAAEASLLRFQLPLARFSGKTYLLQAGANSREGTFPATLPTPYTFLTDAGFGRLALPVAEDRFLAIEPDWETAARLTIQDNRQFKADHYEIQLYLRDGKALRPGQTVRGRFRLSQVSGADLRTEMERHLAPRRRLQQALRQQGTPAIRSATANAAEIPAYGLFELAVDLTATYDNPFDPDQVRLDAFITGPDGREVTVPGFFHCPYQRSRVGAAERLTPEEGAGWRLRFCPRQPGEYRGRLVLKNNGQTAEHPFAFAATPAAHPGMVRVAKGNPLYFEFDNGTPYFAIGENVCWPGPGGTYDYDNYWRRLGESGANYARLWIGPFDCFTLERVARGADDHAGLGRIDLEGAWRVDYVLDEAAKHGIQIMFCIDSFNSLRIKEPHATWPQCPYNQANGGPLAHPREFFTNAEAQKLFQRRLRYIVARWGHCPNLLSWEFWNEVDIIETYVSDEVAAWHRDMGRYLRDIDPYDHLITTSWAGTKGDPAVDALPELDYVQSHQYGARDAADYMIEVCRQKTAAFGKPHYFGEYGTGTRAEGTREDVDGIHLHNGLWSGIFGNAAGTAMLWWWDNYVEPHNLYPLFTPVAQYVQGIPFHTVRYTPPAGISAVWRGTPPPARQEDLLVQGNHASWSPAPFNQPRTVVCHADGRIEGREQLSRLQHGLNNHPALHNPVTFQVDYSAPGRFVVRVGNVSGYGGAGLRIALDGEVKLEKLFPDEDDHNRDITAFSGSYEIEVPAGPHAILVENIGRDWVYLDYILPDYTRRTDPPVRLYALTAPEALEAAPTVLLWARHEAFNWYRHSLGTSAWPVPPTEVIIEGVPDGRFRVKLWDTLSGAVQPGSTVAASGGTVRVPLPAFAKSLAAKLIRETP